MKKTDKDRIETERLLLRAVSYRDVFLIKREFNFDLTLYMTPAPARTIWEEFLVIRGMRTMRKKGTDYIYAVTRRDTGEFLGLCGFHGLKESMPSFGIWIKRSAHGHGYGKEAVYGVAAEAKRQGFREVLYPVDRRNAPSRRIPLSMGGVVRNYEESQSDTGRKLEIEFYVVDLERAELG